MSRTATIRTLQRRDLPFAAALHHQALPHGFLARLGPAFLRRYHATFVDSPHAVALVAEDPVGPAGMIVGPVDTPVHREWVLAERGWRLALAGAAAMLVRPRVLAAFVRTRLGRYARLIAGRGLAPRTADGPVRRSGAPVAVLLHVAVAPHARGTGTGRRLVDAFRRRVAARGAREIRLVTLRGGDGAAPFYRRLGWEHVADRPDRDGRIVCEFRLAVPETARS